MNLHHCRLQHSESDDIHNRSKITPSVIDDVILSKSFTFFDNFDSMRPDFPHKNFHDKRICYSSLMETLAMGHC